MDVRSRDTNTLYTNTHRLSDILSFTLCSFVIVGEKYWSRRASRSFCTLSSELVVVCKRCSRQWLLDLQLMATETQTA